MPVRSVISTSKKKGSDLFLPLDQGEKYQYQLPGKIDLTPFLDSERNQTGARSE
jgi:hypothetical protein